MPNGRPGDSITHDILHHGLRVFGAQADALVRELWDRLPDGQRQDLVLLIEGWPWNPEGTPKDVPELTRRLITMRDALPPAPPRPAVPPPEPPPATPPPPPRQGSAAAAVVGLVIGALVGLPLGFIAYLVAREGLLPTSLWSSDGVMWAVILAVAGPTMALGAIQGGRPTRAGHAGMIALLAFALGSTVCGVGGTVIALVIGSLLGVSGREGGFAMGVVFGLAPLLALLGGGSFAVHAGRRAWRDWRGG
jgi:hypothetical protein